MAIDLTKLPLLLAGPILRRVEERLVSVWVATKHPRKVTLTLRQYASAGATQGTAVTLEAVATQETIAIGKYLHVAVVVAKPTLPLRGAATYGYDLSFAPFGTVDAMDAGAATSDLAGLGLLSGANPLGYVSGRLPTFAGPPADLNELRIIHGSCRKPHGGGTDVMTALDSLIANSRAEPTRRPHQLFLTGDQIYADDVHGELLTILGELGTALLGWNDKGREKVPVTTPAVDLRAGNRAAAIHKQAKMSSGESPNHLMSLAEFVAMYLLVWSKDAWPAMPTFEERYPETALLLKNFGPGSLPPGGSAGPTPLFLASQQQRKFDADIKMLSAFRDGVVKVRRALANVPTFMMFDDHEVTDDWYMDRQWVTDVLGNELGRRIICNALASFAAFQAWGNDPEGEFAAGKPGRKVLDALATLTAMLVESDGTAGKRYDETATAYRDMLRELRLKPPLPQTGGVSWHYLVKWPTHQVLVLDTRTRREYAGAGPLAHPDLLGPTDLEALIGPGGPDGKGGMLGAPTPNSRLLTIIVSPAPVIGHPFVEEFVQNDLAPVMGGSRGVDRESWLVPQRPRALEDLMRRLCARERVLFLSGDVHYGFTTAVQYWDERSTAVKRAGFVQLVASGFRNEGILTHGIGMMAIPKVRAFCGWPDPGHHITRVSTLASMGGALMPLTTSPAVGKLRTGDVLVDEPKWRYRISFSIDDRSGEDRGAPTSTASAAYDWIRKRESEALAHMKKMKFGQMRACVGTNNFGDVRFTWNFPHLIVWHSLWYRLPDNNAVLPYTAHMTTLAPPDPGTARPDPVLEGKPMPPVSAWADLVNFRPPQQLQAIIKAKSDPKWYFHRIENAFAVGPVNLDYYPVLVTTLPKSGQVQLTADELLGTIRRIMGSGASASTLLDTGNCQFRPYHPDEATEEAANAAKWSSADPTGTLISIWINGPLFVNESGTVMCTRWAKDHWIFSTLNSPEDSYHPVSGNRMWGYKANADGTYTFFTRGADRLTKLREAWLESALDEFDVHPVFASADALWRSLQAGIARYVNDNGGVATVLTDETISVRADWVATSMTCFLPTIRWDDGHKP